MIVLVAGLGLLLLLLGLHPYVIYPLTLRRMPRVAASPEAPFFALPAYPHISVCMSVFNEERVIQAKMENLLAMMAAYPGRAELRVYIDGAADGTGALLAPYADRAVVVDSRQRRGKTAGLNLLVEHAQGELLVFTDANVQTPVDGLIRLAAAFADADVGCASSRLVYANPDETAMSATGAAYWNREEVIKALESDTVSVIGVDGAFFAVRRDAYEHAPDHLIDDFYVSLAVLLQGRRVVSCPGIEVYERSAVQWHEEFRRKARIACQAMNVHRAMWWRLRRLPAAQLYGYFSHRLLRWLSPFSLAGGMAFLLLALTGAVGWTAGMLVIAAAAATLVVAAVLGVRQVRLAPMAVVSFGGVALGVAESLLFSRTYVTWTPVDSVRG